MISYPIDGNLAQTLLDAITRYNMRPKPLATAINNYNPDQYWSISIGITTTRDKLYLLPLNTPTDNENIDYKENVTIIDIKPLLLANTLDDTYTILIKIIREVCTRLPIPADARAIPFFLRTHRGHDISCGAALHDKTPIRAILQGSRDTRREMILFHDTGLTTVTCDDYIDYGRTVFYPWSKITMFTVDNFLAKLLLLDSFEAIYWLISADFHDTDLDIAKNMTKHIQLHTTLFKIFTSALEKTAELSRLTQLFQNNQHVDLNQIINMYGTNFAVELLSTLPRKRKYHLSHHSQTLIQVLLEHGEYAQARQIARLPEPKDWCYSFAELIPDAFLRYAYAEVLQIIDEVHQHTPDKDQSSSSYGKWYFWQTAALFQLGRHDEIPGIIHNAQKHFNQKDPYQHLCYAMHGDSTHVAFHVGQAVRFNLLRRLEYVALTGLPAAHPVIIAIAEQKLRADNQARHTTTLTDKFEQTPPIYTDEIIIEDLPTLHQPTRDFNKYSLVDSLVINGSEWLSNLTANDRYFVILTNNGTIQVYTWKANCRLQLHSTLHGSFRAYQERSLQVYKHRLFIADEVTGLFVYDLTPPVAPTLLHSIEPHAGDGYGGMVFSLGTCLIFDNEWLEILPFSESTEASARTCIYFPITVKGGACYKNLLIVGGHNALFSLQRQPSGAYELIDCLRFSSETIDCRNLWLIDECIYQLMELGIWRVTINADGTLKHSGFIRLNFACSPTKISLQLINGNLYIGDSAFRRHVTCLSGAAEPFQLCGARYFPNLKDYFSATAFSGSMLIGCIGSTVHVFKPDKETSDREFILYHTAFPPVATSHPDQPLLTLCDQTAIKHIFNELSEAYYLQDKHIEHAMVQHKINIDTITANQLTDIVIEGFATAEITDWANPPLKFEQHSE